MLKKYIQHDIIDIYGIFLEGCGILEDIKAFSDILMQNKEKIEKHILKLQDIVRLFQERILVGDKDSDICENIIRLISCLKDMCFCDEEIIMKIRLLYDTDEIRTNAGKPPKEFLEIKKRLSEMDEKCNELGAADRLVLNVGCNINIPEERKVFSEEECHIICDCLTEASSLIFDTKQLYYSLSEQISSLNDVQPKIMVNCCPPPPVTEKPQTKRGGFGSKISFRGLAKKKEPVANHPTTMSAPVPAQVGSSPPSVTNECHEEYSCSCVPGEEENKIDISPVKISEVQFSAIVQKKAEKAEYVPVSIIMYEDEFRHIVEERLSDAVKETRSGYHNILKSSKIRVVLSSKDIEIDDCEEEGIWQGKYLEFGFVVELPEEVNKKQILFIATVYVNDLIATRLKFFVDIKSDEEKQIEIEREDIVTAFVSYSSNDRDRVAAIVQGMKKARPDMDIFFDVETLRSGQLWKEALRTEIDKRGVFFLCWSRSASVSKWVDFEWRYALEKKGDESIEPIPIEPPEICPPPIELEQKHFNDKMVYVIKALEYMKRESAYLVQYEHGVEKKVYIDKESFLLGRLQGKVDYLSSNNTVSRIHAEIVREDGKYYIVDLNSANKTYVDGIQCISEVRTPLKQGSIITIGNEMFSFKMP